MTVTANLALPLIEASQAQKHVTHNEALRMLDAAIQVAVQDLNRTVPPAGPAEGQRHIVAAGAAGAWAGQAQAIATFQNAAWAFLTPRAGWCVWSILDAVLFVFDGAAWRDLRGLPLDNLARVGVNTTAAAPNLLSVKSNAALLAAIPAADGGSGDARWQLAKESATNTASVVFSDNYSGRAEFGLVGGNAFKLKVSSDGAGWTEALSVDPASGHLALPRALTLSGAATPPQLTANQNDYSPAELATAAVLRLSADASRSISGLAGGSEGRLLVLRNVGSFDIVLKDASTLSAAANRLVLGGDLTIRAGLACILQYDASLARWVCIAVVAPASNQAADGTAALPAFAFNADPDTGLYRIGSDNIGIAAAGAKVVDIATSGVSVSGSITASSSIAAVGDITASRPGGATGYLNLTATGSHYLGYDGTNYLFNAADVCPAGDNAQKLGSATRRWSQIHAAGAVLSGDITTYRTGGLTGYINLNAVASRYIGYDGANIVMAGAPVAPVGDNLYSCGTAGSRWSVVYAGTGAINTSNAAEKTDLGAIDDRYLLAALDVPHGQYQWLAAVAEKGADRARIHFGTTAQAFRDACLARGVDPTRFAGYCEDPVYQQVGKTRIVERQKLREVTWTVSRVVIEAGAPVLKTVTEVVAEPEVVMTPVRDESGQPVMVDADTPMLHPVPVMEPIEEEYSEPQLTDRTQYGLRYDQFDRLVNHARWLVLRGDLDWQPL